MNNINCLVLSKALKSFSSTAAGLISLLIGSGTVRADTHVNTAVGQSSSARPETISLSLSLLSYFPAFGLLKRKQVCTSCSLRGTTTMTQNDNYQARKIFDMMQLVILNCLRVGREAYKRLADTESGFHTSVKQWQTKLIDLPLKLLFSKIKNIT